MTALAVDTSVAIPLLVATHDAHATVVAWWSGRDLALSGHALVETYSVLTRLPGDLRLSPVDAASLMRARFVEPFVLPVIAARGLVATFADLGIAGGAVYDALVASAALAHDATLATRDARARATYELVGARVVAAR